MGKTTVSVLLEKCHWIDATPDLLLLIQQKLRIVQYRYDSLFNNCDMNTLCPVVNFLKYVVTEVVSFSVVAFKTLAFHKAV